MFKLTYFEDEFAEGEAKTFATYDEAYYAMLDQFDGAAADAGLALQPDITNGGDIFGYNDDTGESCEVGYIGEEDACLEYTEEKWTIEEE